MTTLRAARNTMHHIHPLARGMSSEREEYILQRMVGMRRPRKVQPKLVTIRHFSWEK